jgi:hypothetical protein
MKTFLFILISFIAVTSTLSGLTMINDPNGRILGLSPDLLEGTPFKDYLVPGLLLTTVVGGINIIAVYTNLTRSTNRYNWSIAGGVIITGWIIAQMILIHSIHWLHFIYFSAGTFIALIAYQLKGKWAV